MKKDIWGTDFLKIPIEEKKKKSSVGVANPTKVFILFSVSVLLFIVLDWIKWDLIYDRNNLIKGIVVIGLWLMFFAIMLCFLFYVFQHYSLLTRLITIGLVLLIVGRFFIFPYTKVYVEINYIAFQEKREETLNLLKDNRLEQINEIQYKTKFRLTSHTGTIDVWKEKNRYEVYFYIYKGLWKNSVLIYSSDGKISNTNKSPFQLIEIRELDNHWYSALEVQN